MMFKKVKTKHDAALFNKALSVSWAEKGFTGNLVNGSTDLYMFGKTKDKWVATLEIKPFRANVYTDTFPLYGFNFMKSGDSILEIDNVSILEEYRKTGLLDEVLTVLMDHSFDRGVKYNFAMIEATFCAALIRTYYIPLERLGPAMVLPGDKSPVIPVVLNMEEARNRIPSYVWYQGHKVPALQK